MKRIDKKILILGGTVILAVLFAGGLFALVERRTDDSDSKSRGSTVNYGPATEEEKRETEEHKQELNDKAVKDETTPPPVSDNGKRTVTPLIVFAGKPAPDDNVIEVASYISDIIEDGGTCTVSLTKGTSTVSRNVTGVRDAKVTRCPLVTIPISELSGTGTWNAKVTYSSAAAQGASQTSPVEVK